ncbi:MAG: MFS transporter [Planctomycetes bacterium]|nr:MFS transporter [Planctomycetota bacterium]
MAATVETSQASAPGTRVRSVAWVAYDLANTIYAAAITYLFTPYFTDRFADSRTALGVTTTVSMLLAGGLSPLLGALVDRTGRTRTCLVVATLTNVAAMLAFGLGGDRSTLLLGLFVANVAYQSALTFYNALLPSVAAPGREGWLSGIGTGVGYFGNVVVLVSLLLVPPASFAEAPPYLAFGGAAFLLFALPCLGLVRDTRSIAKGPLAPALRAAWTGLGETLRELPRHRALSFFLLGNFFVVDVLNTAIQFFGDFVKESYREAFAAGTLQWFGMPFGPQAGSMVAFLGTLGLAFSLLAFAFGLVVARWTDRYPLAVMLVGAAALGGALAGGAWFAGGDTTLFTVTLVGGGALAMASVWTAGRKVVLLLAPPDRVGEHFGLYGITVKVSVLGSTTYGVLADRFGSGPALLAQGVPLLLGITCLAMVRLPAPTPATSAR